MCKAVGAVLATADDDHLSPLRGDYGLRVDALAGDPPVLLHQVVHCEMNPLQLASGDVDVARSIGTDPEHHSIETLTQLLGGHIDADVVSGLEDDALRLE